MIAFRIASMIRRVSQIARAVRRNNFTRIVIICSSGLCLEDELLRPLNEANQSVPLDNDTNAK
jgi:hypothetical protein